MGDEPMEPPVPRIIRRVPGDGVELACAKWPGQGEPIVAIHGLTASYATFVGLGERLAGRRPLVAFDLRGRGDSDKPPGPYSLEQHARDVAAGMRGLGLGRSVVVGHSMGAYVATALALEAPDLVAGLVFIDGGLTAPMAPGTDVQAVLEAVLQSLAERLTMQFESHESYRDYWRSRGVFTDADWSRWIDEYLAYDLEGEEPTLTPKPLASAVREDWFIITREDEVEARLRQLRVPVQIIRAEFGFSRALPPVLPDAAVARIRACVPSTTVETIPGTTHYTIVLADPGATRVADLLVAFAERCGT
jgi:lipase